MFTIIIPIDLTFRPGDIFDKAIFFAVKAGEEKIKLVFGLNDRETFWDEKFYRVLSSYKNVVVNKIVRNNSSVNSSLLRNVAFEKVMTKYVVIYDVDIYPDFSMLYKYVKLLSSNVRPFYILPCLYLSKYGSVRLLSGIENLSTLKEKYFSFSRKEFLHLASPSSLTIMKSNDFEAINGFDISYEGHGYEDFDFLLRLSKLYNIFDYCDDFYLDKVARSPLFAVGFRKYLGKLCIDCLLNKEFAFHLYHEKDSSYHSSRLVNKNIFMEKHCVITENVDQAYKDTLIVDFINECRNRDLNIHNFSILFENKPDHIDRYETFKKKLRFLFK